MLGASICRDSNLITLVISFIRFLFDNVKVTVVVSDVLKIALHPMSN